MNNLVSFPHAHPEHDDPQSEARPDPEELQRLLGELVSALDPHSRSRDQEIRLRNFRGERFGLVDDLIVVLETCGDQYIANSYDTGQYGHGYSPDTAIQHLCSVIEDYYELLLEDEGRLSPALNAHLRYLKSILRAR